MQTGTHTLGLNAARVRERWYVQVGKLARMFRGTHRHTYTHVHANIHTQLLSMHMTGLLDRKFLEIHPPRQNIHVQVREIHRNLCACMGQSLELDLPVHIQRPPMRMTPSPKSGAASFYRPRSNRQVQLRNASLSLPCSNCCSFYIAAAPCE